MIQFHVAPLIKGGWARPPCEQGEVGGGILKQEIKLPRYAKEGEG